MTNACSKNPGAGTMGTAGLMSLATAGALTTVLSWSVVFYLAAGASA